MISAVIVTFNSKRFIGACLQSIFNQGYRVPEVIVVDNSSKDGTVDLIKTEYPQVILIRNNANLGASKARNQGIEASSGNWVLIMDCDVILDCKSISNIVEEIKSVDQDTGMLQPKVYYSSGEKICTCGVRLTWSRRFHDIARGRLDRGQFDKSGKIFGASSACALYSRKMLEETREKTGYFDERFFFMVEDMDLAWRAQRKGWNARYCPQIICYHSGNSSVSDKRFRQYLCFRNRYYSILKNEGLISYLKKIIPLVFYDIPDRKSVV